MYGYALQIYLDFSAYSDIAIGSADLFTRLHGLPENFRTPYRSGRTSRSFWRRCTINITLSTWLRDYLYISLGGSRGAPWRTYVNLALTMLLGGLWHGASWTFVVWGALHGFGLAVTRFFQRTAHAARDGSRAAAVLAGCVVVALGGLVGLRFVDGTWRDLCLAWLTLTPLWAVATAWLGREPEPVADVPTVGVPWHELPRLTRIDRALVVEGLRLAMLGAGAGFFAALEWGEYWTWIPLAVLTWALGLAADAVEGDLPRALVLVRRGIAVVLVFHYVCLAWIFFRATSFDNALDVLRQLARGETDRANLIPIVTTALAVGFLCHFFADGGFRWARARFAALPPPAQGAVLAAAYFILRELAQPKLLKFIYFQF